MVRINKPNHHLPVSHLDWLVSWKASERLRLIFYTFNLSYCLGTLREGWYAWCWSQQLSPGELASNKANCSSQQRHNFDVRAPALVSLVQHWHESHHTCTWERHSAILTLISLTAHRQQHYLQSQSLTWMKAGTVRYEQMKKLQKRRRGCGSGEAICGETHYWHKQGVRPIRRVTKKGV